MRKNLLLIPLSIVALGLTSCNKNTYTFTKEIEVELDDSGTPVTAHTYGFKNFNAKKGTTYTFVYDFSKAPINHDMKIGGESGNLFAFAFDIKVDKDKCSVKYNGKELNGAEGGVPKGDIDYSYGEFEDLPGAYEFEFNHERLAPNWKNTDKITFQLACSEDNSNSTIMAVYGDD